MNFGFIVLAFHKYLKEKLGSFKAKYFRQIAIFIVKLIVNFIDINLIDYIERIYNFRNCNTDIPNYFRSALLLTVKFLNNYVYYYFNKIIYLTQR